MKRHPPPRMWTTASCFGEDYGWAFRILGLRAFRVHGIGILGVERFRGLGLEGLDSESFVTPCSTRDIAVGT